MWYPHFLHCECYVTAAAAVRNFTYDMILYVSTSMFYAATSLSSELCGVAVSG